MLSSSLHRSIAQLAISKRSINEGVKTLGDAHGYALVASAAGDLAFSARDVHTARRLLDIVTVAEMRAGRPRLPARAKENPSFDVERMKQAAARHFATAKRVGGEAAQQAKVSSMEARMFAMDQALRSLDVVCDYKGAPGEATSLAMVRLGHDLDYERTRLPRSARRNPEQPVPLSKSLLDLLATLFAVKTYAWTAHWNAKGPTSYSDHLLWERLYTKIDKSIDKLGEQFVNLTGQPVPFVELAENVSFVLPLCHDKIWQTTGIGGDVTKWAQTLPAEEALLLLVQRAQEQSDKIRVSLPGPGRPDAAQMKGVSASGLDNYLNDLNDRLDTFVYLITQRGEK